MAHAILKLVSGETIIADVNTSTKENHINVTDPLVLRTGIDDDNRMVMSMYKWMETAQTTFTIEKSHVILRAAPSEPIIDYYNEVLEDGSDYYDDEDHEPSAYEENYSTSIH